MGTSPSRTTRKRLREEAGPRRPAASVTLTCLTVPDYIGHRQARHQ